VIDDHYKAIIESADDPIFICDRDGRFIYGNPKAAANFGLTTEQFAGRTVYELFAPEVAAVFAESVRRVIDTGEPSKTEDHLFIHGVEFWNSTVLQPLINADGRIIALQGIVRDITSRKQADLALQAGEERLRQVIRASHIGVFDLDFVTRTIYWSPEQRAIWGWGADEPLAWDEHRQYIHPEDAQNVSVASAAAHQRPDGVFELEHRIVRRSGDTRWLIVRAQAFFEGPDHRLVRVIGATRDVTDERAAREERDELHERLVQAQRLESIGRLAGGIAHDFNNILNIIIGCAEMAASEPNPSIVSGYLDEILKAATRSADLTKQLLGFARRQTAIPRVVDLNDFVSASLKMLRRLIGEHVTLYWHPGVELWPVRIDPGQIDQILVNLMTNARDAIADVGEVVIHTENVPLSSSAQYPGLPPGEYVRLGVVDNGKGMDTETQRHLFEPFYTTKLAGRGTGLGMASVDGIVRQNAGAVTVTSDVGRGTTVNIFLPRALEALPAKVEIDRDPPKRGTETILVVEDEPALLQLTTRALGALGYTVLAASTPEAAIEIVRTHRGSVDMLLTDVVLPGMNGRNLADRLLQDAPGLKCLFVSGYPDNAMGSAGMVDESLHFLQKPFSPRRLADKVRQVFEI
jgi:PAS domain S-box-containing protein